MFNFYPGLPHMHILLPFDHTKLLLGDWAVDLGRLIAVFVEGILGICYVHSCGICVQVFPQYCHHDICISLCRITNSRVYRQHWPKSGYKLSSLTLRALLMDKALMDPRDHLIPLSFHLKLFVHHFTSLISNAPNLIFASLFTISIRH